MKITVIMPTYRRPHDLWRCLTALNSQVRQADEILVAVRNNDATTMDFISQAGSIKKLKIVKVSQPGVIAAMNAGLAAATSDIIALTDDDAVPHADWLVRIAQHFEADPKLGGIGGRDWVWVDDKFENEQRRDVGKVQWFGRVIGNHHIGIGPPRDVDILKGVNCAFRGEPLKRIGFDFRLRGAGAQVHWEMSLCLRMRREGWRLLYDPRVAVDHYPAKRADPDINSRGGFHGPSLTDAVHNETLVLLEHFPPAQRLLFAIWAILIGTGGAPGLAQVLRTVRTISWLRFKATLKGRLMGIKSFRNERRILRRHRVSILNNKANIAFKATDLATGQIRPHLTKPRNA